MSLERKGHAKGCRECMANESVVVRVGKDSLVEFMKLENASVVIGGGGRRG